VFKLPVVRSVQADMSTS